MNQLGEIFYRGKIMNLEEAEQETLENMYDELENAQAEQKERITGCLQRMRKEG